MKANVLLIACCISIHSCSAWSAIPRHKALASSAVDIVSTSSSNLHRKTTSTCLHYDTTSTNDDKATILSDAPSSTTIPYNWKNQWYAVTYASYLPNPSKSAEVTPVSIFGEPLVLWRSEDNGVVHCANDVCPHRSAALSEGRVRDGMLECYYHGWQFNGENVSSLLSSLYDVPFAFCIINAIHFVLLLYII